MKQTAKQRSAERYPDSAAFTARKGNVHRRSGYATCIREEVEPLEAWKESAIKVMGEWDKVHEALGKPGKLGESMAAASLAEIERLRALVQELGNALSLIGIHDEHSGSVCEAINHGKGMLHEGFDPCPGIKLINSALHSFHEQGFVPTNTTE